jgi:hypothetical protein
MSCVKCFELGISNTCDEGVCDKKLWPQDHKDGAWTRNDDHGGDAHKMIDMMFKWRRRI